MWYEIVNRSEPLLQGDFVPKCPVILPNQDIVNDISDSEVEVNDYNVVVITHSCDLVGNKIGFVLVCPHYQIDEWEKATDFYKSDRGKEVLRRGYVPGYHMLDKCDLADFQMNYCIVDFRNAMAIPFDFITEYARKYEKRLRIQSPYREHLSQAFGRFFMRVGLPTDIPPFYKFPFEA